MMFNVAYFACWV